ncbi:MAG: multiubiquitin domain-containing protein [Acidimicrobiaceae bacterium]|nr:multiubiquitin domain-containing protein [Acidimicrobiaceae bacterium]MDE0516029.1 multiubiquitin domain-containing protein [Acidimicrobiaceae bacterium]
MKDEAEIDIDDHKHYTIIVNSRSRTVEEERITYDEVVRLAFDNPPTGDQIEITVSYRNGPRGTQGFLTKGQSVKIIDDMVFNVKATDKS